MGENAASFLRTKTRRLEENEEKHGGKENPERKKKKENKREALRASLNYAEELGPLRFLGRRSETGAGWLSEAGEYCGDTGEDCDAFLKHPPQKLSESIPQ